jgi:hypothetical protein
VSEVSQQDGGEEQKRSQLAARVADGEVIVMFSPAGMPGRDLSGRHNPTSS